MLGSTPSGPFNLKKMGRLDDSMKGIERRHSPRVRARFWMQMDGVDREMVCRSGDLSVTGVFVELSAAPGPLGSTVTLSLATEDKRLSARVVARLVRLVQSQDIWSESSLAGVAYQFLPATEVERNAVQELVLHAARNQALERKEVELEHRFSALLDHGAGERAKATVHKVHLGGMSIETTWRLDPGQVVRVEIPTPDGRSIQFAGSAAAIMPSDSGKFQVDVEFDDPAALPSMVPQQAGSVETAVTTFIERMLVPSMPPIYSGDLAGRLEAIAPPTLLSLLELSEMSGVLVMKQPKLEGRIFICRGQVVDVELATGSVKDVRTALAELCQCTEGTFEFRCQEIERESRLDMRTSAVLIDIARIQDEIRAKRSEVPESPF